MRKIKKPKSQILPQILLSYYFIVLFYFPTIHFGAIFGFLAFSVFGFFMIVWLSIVILFFLVKKKINKRI